MISKDVVVSLGENLRIQENYRVMLRYITTIAAILSLAILPSQAQKTYPIGVNGSGSELALSEVASSTLVVNMEVEIVRVEVGKYARYAQEFLGVRAPLVAKQTATIISADVALAPADYFVATDAMLTYRGAEQVESYSEPLPIDISSADLPSVEDAAEEAANAIFALRSLRRDILTGELGEGFYGGGLAAALERLEYEERAYAELFFGRTTTSRERYTQYVPLSVDEKRYIVCRFSPTEGVVESSNLKAERILMQLTPAKQSKPEAPLIDAKSKSVEFRVSNLVKCDLYCNSAQIATKSIPLPEFGYNLTYVITPEK